jgi:hypothetical protein
LLNQYIVDYTRSDHPHALAIEATLTAVLRVVWPTQKAKKKEKKKKKKRRFWSFGVVLPPQKTKTHSFFILAFWGWLDHPLGYRGGSTNHRPVVGVAGVSLDFFFFF